MREELLPVSTAEIRIVSPLVVDRFFPPSFLALKIGRYKPASFVQNDTIERLLEYHD